MDFLPADWLALAGTTGSIMRATIVVVRIGYRPWFRITIKWLNYYAWRHHHDVIVCNTPYWSEDELPRFRHAQNFGRIQKLGIGRYFGLYDRLLLVDDTCLISPKAGDIVGMTPYGEIGAMLEDHLQKDYKKYLAFNKKLYKRKTMLGKDTFLNGGVLVLSREHSPIFDPDSIPWNTIAADDYFPVQGYISHQAEVLGFKVHDLGLEYNFCGSAILRNGPSPNLPDDVKIFHLTSALTLEQRLAAASIIDDRFSKELNIKT